MAADNSDIHAKIAIRKWALEQIGGPAKANVLELFGGEGHLYDAVWHEAKAHISFEMKAIQGPNRVVGDNRALLPLYLGVDAKATKKDKGWNVFDSDAYGDPWCVLGDVARLRGPGKYVATATCGIAGAALVRKGQFNAYLRKCARYENVPWCQLLYRWYEDIVRWAWNDWRRFGVRVAKAVRVKSREGGHAGQQIFYYGLVLEKMPTIR